MEQYFDYVIVGAGTAGCVLASRLTQKPTISVLLLEAGLDFPPGQEPRSIRDPFPASYGDPQFAWPGLVAEVGPDPGDGGPRFSRPFVQGRMVGGSSSIMGMMAQRGLPADFEEWAALGAIGWNWEGVLPYFNRLENDWDFDGPLHGKDGPIPIRRYSRADWPAFVLGFAEAIEDEGYPFHDDMNGYFGDCLTKVPMNNRPDSRVSSAMGYLGADVRRRPNLTIISEATAERLILEGRRVVGVSANIKGNSKLFFGGEILVCAGAVHSPALLMRSGIGPKAALHRAGVTPVTDRPGVGQNLFNHAIVHIAVHLPARSQQAKSLTSWAFAMLRYSSRRPGCPPGDMQIFPTNRTSWHPLGRRIGAAGVCLYKPFSTGAVELRSADWRDEPIVKFNLLRDPRDFERMVDGVRRCCRYLASDRLRGIVNEAFLPPGGQANALNRPSLWNWVKSAVIAVIFDLPFGVRRRLLGDTVLDLAELAGNPAACAQIVRRVAAAVHHASGTCRMGRAEDPGAVVDPHCRVYGVEGLRVVDASIMPTVVSANTHLCVLMIGERVAQLIQDGRRNAMEDTGTRPFAHENR